VVVAGDADWLQIRSAIRYSPPSRHQLDLELTARDVIFTVLLGTVHAVLMLRSVLAAEEL
jgi:hypothetical protein